MSLDAEAIQSVTIFNTPVAEIESPMSNGDYRPEWGDVDADADEATAYLDTVTGLEAIQEYKTRSHRLLHPKQGDCILDAGCGAGDDVRTLADRVAPDGKIIGIDKSKSLIEEARERAGEMDTLEFRVGDILQLPFEDGTFNACRADRVLQHLKDPEGALAEMRRVTRPDGRIAVDDPDWETCIVTAPDADPEVTEAVTDGKWADAVNPTTGRHLYLLARDVGLTDIEIDPTTIVLTDFEVANEVLYLEERLDMMQEAGVLSVEQADRWLETVHRAGRDKRLFCAITGFTVAGTVPTGKTDGS